MQGFVQRSTTFPGISRTQVDTVGISSSYEVEGLPGQDCNHYYMRGFFLEHQSAIHVGLHPGLCRFQSVNT